MTERQVFNLCKKYLKAWYKVLGLGDWSLYLIATDLPDGDDNCREGFAVRAWVDACWEYKSARLNVVLPNMITDTPEAIEQYIVHELVHACLNEMREKDKNGKHEERVCVGLTDAFIDLRDGVLQVKHGK